MNILEEHSNKTERLTRCERCQEMTSHPDFCASCRWIYAQHKKEWNRVMKVQGRIPQGMEDFE